MLAQCKRIGITDAAFVGADDTIRERLEKEGLAVAGYVQCHLPDSEVEAAKKSKLFAYQVRPLEGQPTRAGINSYADGVRYLREHGVDARIYASVGIRTPDDIRMVKAAGADGAFIGGVLMRTIDDEKKLKSVLRSYVEASNE